MAYADKLAIEPMNIDGGHHGGSRMSLNDRFERIQGAKPRPVAANAPRSQNAADSNRGKTLRIATRPKVAALPRRFNR